MHWLSPLLLAVGVFAGCQDLTGTWRNTKGSTLHLEQIKHHLHGTFRTMVEISQGSAGKRVLIVRNSCIIEDTSGYARLSPSLVSIVEYVLMTLLGAAYTNTHPLPRLSGVLLLTETRESC